MRVSAVIAEYNIFHNGHKFLAEKMHESSDAVIALMSGSFVQRGDAAIADKWQRAESALLNGVDLVIELPAVYAVNTAQRFAYGGVNIINSLGMVDELHFGSEVGNTDALLKAAQLLKNEPPEVSEKIKKYTSEGMNYPSAREKAYGGLIDGGILSSPNNILALEYIIALKQLKSGIIPVAAKRTGAGHHDEKTNGKFASAAAIRNMILNGRDYSEYVPIGAEYKLPYKLSQLDSALIYKLRTMSIDELRQINDVNEGLENRIKRLCMEYSSIDELAEGIKTKRYTRTRINRVLISALLEFTKGLCASEPSYIRVLGMNTTGMKLLSEIKKCCKYPIVTKTADFDRENPMFQAEIRATDAFSLCAPQNGLKKGGRDFTTSPVIV